ncbi:MAG: NAD(P)H-dependent oxidoreductase [Bdellovibrionaceae bacterium]|nr:NAD(P)H-dependent oxidoreductase [Pseudobdellovibrionaceae bacterium]
MPSSRNVVLVGSLRKESFSRMVARALIAVTPKSVMLEVLEIGQLPMYNQDLDESPPAEWVDFRKSLKGYHGVIFVTPEYNRSVPGVLKNAIDVASRPYGQNALNRKPGAVISVSIGSLGGFGANHHLRQSLVFLNVPTMPQPEAYISEAAKLFETSGNLSNESTRVFLTQFMSEFVAWVDNNKQ